MPMMSLVSRIICAGFAAVLSLHYVNQAHAQGGLRETLEQMDKNNDGKIDRDEITPLARPYLERITRARSMSLERPNDIDKLQEAARIYHAIQNGVAGKTIRPRNDRTVLPFGATEGDTVVPGFGLAEVKFPYTQTDLDEADRTLRRNDDDDDGFLDSEEIADGKWTHRDPYLDDLDNDNRLSRLELAQRYARRRLLKGDSGELVQQARRVGNGIRSSDPDDKREDRSQWWRKGGTDFWLTAAVFGRYDENKNSLLDLSETEKLGIPITKIDLDRNGEVTREELHVYMANLQMQSGEAIEGMPGWFYELDSDRDGQVAMAEFTDEWTEEKSAEFATLDRNRDGLLTAIEVSSAKSQVGGSFENRTHEILAPRRTIISEIVVEDDFKIRDLNLQINITHTATGQLDAYLTGPEGQRIELFTEVGGKDDHFSNTRIDDQAREIFEKSRPPFEGTYLPEGVQRGQPGLSYFNGKSVKGVWQLVIRGTRSDRFGMLHNWSLQVQPEEDQPIIPLDSFDEDADLEGR